MNEAGNPGNIRAEAVPDRSAVMSVPNLTEKHRKVLRCLADDYSSDGMGFSGFAAIMAETKLDRRDVRLACRHLTRKGLAQFGRGLWTEDGEPRGSGYAATRAGADLDKSFPRACEDCGKNPADLPSLICVGCDAYREHQQ